MIPYNYVHAPETAGAEISFPTGRKVRRRVAHFVPAGRDLVRICPGNGWRIASLPRGEGHWREITQAGRFQVSGFRRRVSGVRYPAEPRAQPRGPKPGPPCPESRIPNPVFRSLEVFYVFAKKSTNDNEKVSANERIRKLAHGPVTGEGRDRIHAAHLHHGYHAQDEEAGLLLRIKRQSRED